MQTDTPITPIHLWTNGGDEVLVVRFCNKDGIEGGPCPHASLLVAWGTDNASKLHSSQINGHFLWCNKYGKLAY